MCTEECQIFPPFYIYRKMLMSYTCKNVSATEKHRTSKIEPVEDSCEMYWMHLSDAHRNAE